MKNTFLKNASFCVCMCSESYKEHFLLYQPVLVMLFKVSSPSWAVLKTLTV